MTDVFCTPRSANSCLAKVGKNTYRTLVDSGASVCVMHERVYDQLRPRPPLRAYKGKTMKGASGKPLHTVGIANVSIDIAGTTFNQDFHVMSNVGRNLILGLNWMLKHKVHLYFDEPRMRIGNQTISLEEDVEIASVVRLCQDVQVPPQTAIFCKGGLKNTPYFAPNQPYHLFTDEEKGSLANESGLILPSSLVTLDSKMRTQVLLINNTNKTYKLKRGCVVGRVSSVDNGDISAINKEKHRPETSELDLSSVKVPEDHRKEVINLIQRNKDIFAKNDFDLGQTDTVKMKIDTGDHPPIRLRPYRTPLTSRPIVDKAIDDMLQAGVIERSNSEWSFPIVLVKKKDQTTRFCVDYRKLNLITRNLTFP